MHIRIKSNNYIELSTEITNHILSTDYYFFQ